MTSFLDELFQKFDLNVRWSVEVFGQRVISSELKFVFAFGCSAPRRGCRPHARAFTALAVRYTTNVIENKHVIVTDHH